MKITKKELDYTFNFDHDKEIEEFVAWCIENQNIINVFRLHCYTSSSKSGSVNFKDEEGAMAFKLRWL